MRGSTSEPAIDRRRVLGGISGIGAGALALGGCGPWTRLRKNADVIIVGAGLSGLFAAMELAGQGLKVLVLEAGDRVGGRLWTLDDLPGRPEAGGSQVGQTYARIRYAAERVGVDIIEDPPPTREDRLLMIGATGVLQSAWGSSPLNPFPEAFRAAAPDSVLFAAAGRDNPFQAPADWRAARVADRSADEYLAAAGFNDEARRLIDVALNANSLKTYSILNVWRTLQLYAVDAALGRSGDIAGGSQRLPEAMAASLGDAVRLGAAVERIVGNGGGVEAVAGGRSYFADFCILALPFPAIRRIALEPAPVGAQADAIRGLPYTQILQLHVAHETRFWESDGLPAPMWTDGPLERIFPTKDRESGEILAFNCWINGERARELGALDDAALTALAQKEFLRLRPASAGAIRLLRAVRWTEGAYSGGAYMHWAPDEIADWAAVMGAPLGRIHFAGEHLSYLHTGMEGAMESGQNAALAVLEAAA